jgi:rRNA maturation protein Nop10
MKILITVLMGLIPVVFIIGVEGESAAFHDGGVGPCEGCHTMHNSYQGAPINGKPAPQAYLLRESDPSSVCLYCHQRSGDVGPTTYHISTPDAELPPGVPPKQLTPGGDFGWLKKTFSWLPASGQPAKYSFGDRHGHNIAAADFLYNADGTNTTAPGGSYPAAGFSCTSCHDPHGKYRRNLDGSITATGKPIKRSGSFASSPEPDGTMSVGAYRLLGGKNYQPKSLTGGYAFVYDPPIAVAPNWPNRSEDATQTRVAYGSGMSEWCRNCHANMHTPAYPGSTNLIHASGNNAKLGVTRMNNYYKYINTGTILSSPSTTPYLSLVPFEEGTTDYSTLKAHAKTDDSYLDGPNTSANVMCLSCHRAHASGWDGIMRWNAETAFIVSNGFYSQQGQAYQPYGQGRMETEALRAYYNKPASAFGLNQDTLCNKCHIGDYSP